VHMGKTLVMVFIAGVIIYEYREMIPWSRYLFIPALVITLLLLSITNGERFVDVPAAYATVYLGLMNPRKNKYVLSGDYSYGLYLYGYPLQQAFVSINPYVRNWYWNLLVAIPATFLIAYISWWLVEKPALSEKTNLKKLEDWCLSFSAKGRAFRENILKMVRPSESDNLG
jgi:peptidoglycan/LPS O-acetylase OafA/YrhL